VLIWQKKPTWPLHEDCLIEECAGADEDEEKFIEQVAEEVVEEKEDENEPEDEAGAVGDPHLNGPGRNGRRIENEDLCCEGGHCSACE